MGLLRFDEFVDTALYDPDGGFYTAGGSAGRRGDFITSPEVGPLFAAVVGRALDAWWSEIGEPDPFMVVEVGAGVGTLARTILAASPRCSGALTYVMVERSERLRARQGDHIELHDRPKNRDGGSFSDLSSNISGGNCPRFFSDAAMPEGTFVGVVLANELLDNFAFRLLERRGSGWQEIFVESEDPQPQEILVQAPSEIAALADELAPDAPIGSRVAIQEQARRWVRESIARIRRGRLVVIDYATTSGDMSHRPWSEWVRTYRAHGYGGIVLDSPGTQDITCEVAVDQLSLDVTPVANRSQAEFLEAHGIDQLVEDGRRIWNERAHIGDLDALKARSRVTEAEALRDPGGLGSFRVLEWVVG